MYIAGQKEMQEMDRYTMETLGLPGIVLMENAGAKVVEDMAAHYPLERSRVLVLTGGGNNGGDGFVIARRLIDMGVDAAVWLLADETRVRGDAKIHFDVYKNRKLPLYHLKDHTFAELEVEIRRADIIVDAILGTGVHGPVRDPYAQAIALVNALAEDKPVISVDIPSGVDSETGKVEGEAVKASRTITFVFPKKGFFLNEGPQYIGEWKAVDISVPPGIVKELGFQLPKLMTESLAKSSIPKRPSLGHKGTFGHVLVIGGSKHFVGAPVFTAKAALNLGAGLVTLAVPETMYPIAASLNPESLFFPLPEKDGHFAEEAIAALKPELSKFDCVAIGPGMGRFPNGERWMTSFIKDIKEDIPLVVDADALYLLRNDLDLVNEYSGPVIFTPHPGEMAHLLNKTVKEIETDRIGTATEFARNYNVFLLLKGHRSVIAAPDGSVYINPLGHDALGKGGSGDVLTGMIASFIAQGASPLDALISASFLHAKAGEEQAKVLSHYGVLPMDLIDGAKRQLIET